MVLNAKTSKPFPTGLIPTPRHRLLSTPPHKPVMATPAQWPLTLAAFLEMWLNDQYGDCVTAEEAAAKAQYSAINGLPETKITDATVLAFCNKYGFLNGAMLPDVMDKMISDGFQQDNGYKDGPYTGVDYSNEATLQNAISIGPVKIGIDANALPSGAGNKQGWTAFGGSPGQFTNEDHCVALWGFGPVAYLASLIQKTYNVTVQIPTNAPANGYILYTWSTVGIVDHAWIMSTCGEAFVRNPTTVGVVPVPPVPPVPPTPPTPPVPPVPPTPPTPPVPPTPTPGILTLPATITLNGDGTWVQGGAGAALLEPDTVALVKRDLGVTGNSRALPPFILVLLKFLCPLAPTIPPPFGTILIAICALIPHSPRSADSWVTISISDELQGHIDRAASQPLPFAVGSVEERFFSWLLKN